MEFHEKVSLSIYDIPADYLAKPPSFPRAAYMGYAIIVTEAQTRNILWEHSTREGFLMDARKRFISQYVPKQQQQNFSFPKPKNGN
jgi:hypothetical protein